jgi:hypothetical protein
MNVLLLFSRKDLDSKDLFSYISKSETLRQNIFPICVDSKDIFDILTSSTNIVIESIPCLLLKNPNQSISKFEGIVKIFEVLNEIQYNAESQQVSNESLHTDLNDLLEDVEEEKANSTPENIKITSPPINQPRVTI